MEAPIKKWEPGKEPAYPSHSGTTQKPGMTMRDDIAARLLAASMPIIHTDIQKSSRGNHAEMMNDVLEGCIALTDSLILKLYPEPVRKVIGTASGPTGCEHVSIVFEQGKFQCLACRQEISKETIASRTSVKAK